jgi:hypothetical protein
MGDMMQFDPLSANHNEKVLYALLNDRQAEIQGLAHELANRTNAKLDSVAGSVAALDDAHVLLVKLNTEIAQLKLRLFGDEDMRAKWEQAQNTGTYPNYPGGARILEPAPGELDELRKGITIVASRAELIDDGVTVQNELFAKLTKTLGTSDHSFTFLRKLEAFFGPMIEGKNPPLDGNQIATKDYVDKAVERIAGRIREQVQRSIEVTQALWDRVSASANGIGERLATVVDREYARIAAEERDRDKYQPSRIESLVHAFTGRNGGRSR